MASIPPDIITEILCRLGVEDLLRYRCVSKGWCSLIDSPDFIKHHLSHSRLSLLLRDRCLCSVNFDSLETSQILNHSFEENDEYYTPKILGSCNGLVALRGDFFGEKLALWNPSTRKSIMLPVSKIESIFHRFTAYRLGYDPISDDYKLVRMAQLDRESYNDDDGVSEVNFYGLRADPPRTNDNDDSFGSQVNVYSLRTNSWRTIQEFPYYLRRSNGILASNALHWLVSKNPQLDTSFIAAFDLGTEEYRLLEAPDCLGAEFHTEFHELYMMKAMGDCLCILSCYLGVEFVDIWVMTQYGVKESWTKSVTVQQPGIMGKIFWPLAFSKRGDQVLFMEDHRLIVWYDLRKKIVKKERWIEGSSSFKVEMLVASLVPLHGWHNE